MSQFPLWPREASERNIGRIIRVVISTAIIAVAMIMIPPVTSSIANQDIFNKTGEACSSCHTAPVSNGVLNQHGEDFRAKFFGSGGTPQVVAPQCPPGFALSGNQCVFVGGPSQMPAAGMNCDQLWHARNAIFAARGHCFKTPRGKAAFPNSCFPPFGKLPPDEQARVAAIETSERVMGCR